MQSSSIDCNVMVEARVKLMITLSVSPPEILHVRDVFILTDIYLILHRLWTRVSVWRSVATVSTSTSRAPASIAPSAPSADAGCSWHANDARLD